MADDDDFRDERFIASDPSELVLIHDPYAEPHGQDGDGLGEPTPPPRPRLKARADRLRRRGRS